MNGARPRQPSSRSLILPIAGLLAACGPHGEGQVSGTLFLRGCPELEETGQPAPFQLDPEYFAADTVRAAAAGASASDPDVRIPDRIEVRLQRSTHRIQLTDALVLYLTDVVALRDRLDRPFPIIAAPLAGDTVQLPTEGPPFARAALLLHGTCPFARVQPQLRGTLTLGELGFEPGEWVSAGFTLDVEDDRGARNGVAPADRDAGGRLTGSFRMQITRGRSTSFP
jgi:hypothetical protein